MGGRRKEMEWLSPALLVVRALSLFVGCKLIGINRGVGMQDAVGRAENSVDFAVASSL